jgi:hypothetical protein
MTERTVNSETVPANIEFDPVFVDVLEQLWIACREEDEQRAARWSLAKLSKRSCLPMSTLRRALTELDVVGLVQFEIAEDGRGNAALSEEGALLSGELFGFVAPKQSH